MFRVAPMLKVGPRIEMVDGSSATTFSGAEFDAEARVIPLELGVSTDMPLAAGLSLDGGLYMGYGLTSSHMDFSQGGGSFDANGDCFVGEAQVAAKYQIVPLLSLGLNLGYRYTTSNTMVTSNANGLFVAGNGHNLPNFEHGGDAKADFSGANLGGAVTFSF
jgi:hypothetical protein